ACYTKLQVDQRTSVCGLRRHSTGAGESEDRWNAGERRRCWRHRPRCGCRAAVTKDLHREHLRHHVPHPTLGVEGFLLPTGRAGREDFDEREAETLHLVLDSAMDGL